MEICDLGARHDSAEEPGESGVLQVVARSPVSSHAPCSWRDLRGDEMPSERDTERRSLN